MVAAHSYRAALVVGVQPRRAEALFAGSDGGTTQRIVWFDVHDREAPDSRPTEPETWSVKAPRWQPGPIPIPQVAIDCMDNHRLVALRGQSVDPLNGHALLSRLKVATALMILEGRAAMDDDDWDLAGQIMVMSNGTREAIQREMRSRKTESMKARAALSDERDEFISDRKVERARNNILRLLAQGAEMSSSVLRRKLRHDLRDHMDVALTELELAGLVNLIEVPNGRRYCLSQESGTPCTERTPSRSGGPPAKMAVVRDVHPVPAESDFVRTPPIKLLENNSRQSGSWVEADAA